MSSAHLTRNRSVTSSTKSRGMVAANAANNSQDFGGMVSSPIMRYFDTCAATAGMFLYAQGNSVVCCHHDTLTIERRFSRHSDEIQLLAVDSQSERGAGRLVVSYDAGQTAIVWDIMSGEEVARFASYEHLTTAAWMRNGNVAFGNTQGNIILFEPETSEHLSTRTLDQIAVTALAPSADCRTFAIGYQNGSLLICNLQPRFTILHNLTTNRAPSPVVNLAWHASSSRQKSDMLATQTNDGDLRVWSVSKAYNSADPAKVVRILKRTENYINGPNWMGWSKNGRIIQFSEGETLSWDVRTKHVTNDTIPTLEHVRGLAVYGPGANLFTLGANNTVQQFDLNAPAMMTANVQHPANLLPPSPPVSIEEQKAAAAAAAASESEISIQLESGVSESEEDRMSPLARMRQTANAHNAHGNVNASDLDSLDRYGMASPASSRSHASSISSASSRTPAGYQHSIQSRGMTENTYISAGSSMASSAMPSRRQRADNDGYSVASSLSSVSMTSSHNRSRRARPSRLRNEVPMSPEESKVQDLFKFTRSRLSDVPYKRPPPIDQSQLTNDDLRRQMLSTIFGWTRDIRDLVRDEMARHPAGSPNRILLAKWLGDIDQDIMATSSENMTSSDWMLLALSGIGSVASQHKLGRAYVQRLLESGDLHAAATIMIGMGDHNDAIEIYVSHKKYLEALILTCLFFPSVWERQSQIIKKWGEWAVQHGRQQLAIRCFSCTDKESTEPWTSPSATQLTFQSMTPASIPEVLSPPLSPPGIQRGPQRSIAKTSALKLITSFGDQSSKSKFFSGQDGGKTPLAGGVTPIAESAISPGGHGGDVTAFLRPSHRSQFNTPASARPHQGSRNRLPSIGEMAADGTPRDRLKNTELPTPPVDYSDHSRNDSGSSYGADGVVENYSTGLGIPRASTASPMMMREQRKKRDPPPPSPGPASMAMLMEGRASRNGPRQRIPDGIDLHLDALDNGIPSDITSPEQSVASSTRFHWPSRRRGPASVASSVTSASTTHSRRPRHNVEGRTLDDYIHSLDAVKTSKSRASSRDGRGRAAEPRSSHRLASRERSSDRGRTASRGYTPKAGKRSPRSPVPMSPEELINLSTPRLHDTATEDGHEPSTVRKSSQIRHSSKTRGASRVSTRSVRRVSPDRRQPPPLDIPRGREDERSQTGNRSPSSPVPMSASVAHFNNSEDEEDYYRAIESKQKFRNRHGQARSTSRGPRGGSPDDSAYRERSRSRRRPSAHINTKDRDSPEHRARTPGLPVQAGGVGEVRYSRDDRARKKEQAARELEERRRSLARQPQAPSIPHPDALSPISTRAPADAFQLPSTTFQQQPARDIRDLPPRSKTTEPSSNRSMYANRPGIGLPATPKAMRLVMDGDSLKGVPNVPSIPQSFGQQQPQQRRSPPLSGSPSPKGTGSPKRLDPVAPAPAPVDPAAVAGGPPSLLTLLPSTVYSPPVRGPPRCMSAPPEEPIAPKILGGGIGGHKSRTSVSSQVHPGTRKLSHPDVLQDQSGMRTIDSLIDSRPTASFARRASNDDRVPPPPPPAPAPPMLKELAHLAMPPPPPPAPLPFGQTAKPVVYGSPAAIEIVMEDGQTQPVPPPPPPAPQVLPMSEATVPVIAAPAPPSSRTSYQPQHRSRQSIDSNASGGIGSRFARATERIRSASRSRQQQSQQQDSSSYAPYESVPMPPPPVPAFAARNDIVSPVQTQAPANAFSTGLLQSEMI